MIAFKYYHDRAKALAYLDKRLSGKNDGNGVPGEVSWFGWGAERLGLRGDLTTEDFRALLENRHPLDGWPLLGIEEKAVARLLPCLTEITIASPRLTAGEMNDDSTFYTHMHAAQITANKLEVCAAGKLSMPGACVITGNVVGITFGRCCYHRGLGRLVMHFVLFGVTFDESEEVWRGLDPENMEEAIPSVVNDYRRELRRHKNFLAMLEQAQRLKAAERLAAATQSFPTLN